MLDYFTKRLIRDKIQKLKLVLKEDPFRNDLKLQLAGLNKELGKHEIAKNIYLEVVTSLFKSNQKKHAEAISKKILEYYPENKTFLKLNKILKGEINEKIPETFSAEQKQIIDEKNKDEIDGLLDDWTVNSACITPVDIMSVDAFEDNWDEPSDPEINKIPNPPKGLPIYNSQLDKPIVGIDGEISIRTSNSVEQDVADIFKKSDEPKVYNSFGDDDFWSTTSLLKELNENSRNELQRRVKPFIVETDSVIINEGDDGNSLFIVIEGEVAVTKLQKNGKTKKVALLKAGDFFGEFALLVDKKRHASVIATKTTKLLELSKQLINSLGKKHPAILNTLKSLYNTRLQDLMIKNLSFFSIISVSDRDKYFKDLHFHKFTKNTPIIKQGEKSGGFFLIMLGEVEIIFKDENGEKLLAVLGEGEYFGEMALLKRQPAMATVKTRDTVELMQIPAKLFFQILADHPPIWRRLQEEVKKRDLLDLFLISGRGSGNVSFLDK
jgi:CRP-like cAMP-binding protein